MPNDSKHIVASIVENMLKKVKEKVKGSVEKQKDEAPKPGLRKTKAATLEGRKPRPTRRARNAPKRGFRKTQAATLEGRTPRPTRHARNAAGAKNGPKPSV